MTSGIRYLIRVAIFLIVGPILGGILVAFAAAFAGTHSVMGGLVGGVATVTVGLPLFLIASYMMGWKPALVAGLIIALAGPWIGSRLVLLSVAALVGTGAAVALPGEKSFPVVLLGFVGAASAVVCAWFVERVGLMRGQQTPFA